MICPDCRTENPSDGKVCFQCGGTLTVMPLSVPDLPPLPASVGEQMAPPLPSPTQSPIAMPAPPAVPYAPQGYAAQAPQGYAPQYPVPYPGSYPAPAPAEPSIIDTFVPMGNPKALTAYYLGIFSFIPLLGIFLGIAAFVLGLQGLKAAKQTPEIKGKTHAWIGIVIGGFFGFGYILLFGGILIAVLLSSSNHG
ncbi:MAG: hypothetical protein JWN14_2855 [Chthonomonadales bacterium]|nr:hypothetical protein [Chthonomonadales bacterium]